MEIRELQEKDETGLRKLILSVYDESPNATTFGSRPTDSLLAELFARKMSGMRNGVAADYVAVEGGSVIADCEIVRAENGRCVAGVIVSGENRRHGVGGRLLDSCLKKAQALEFGEVYAEIDKRNGGAISFFSSRGFEKQDSGSEGIIRMRRSLLV